MSQCQNNKKKLNLQVVFVHDFHITKFSCFARLRYIANTCSVGRVNIYVQALQETTPFHA